MIVSFGTDQKATPFFELSLRFLVGRMIATTSGVPPVSRVQDPDPGGNHNDQRSTQATQSTELQSKNGPMTKGSEK
jgi:hypothetical protein